MQNRWMDDWRKVKTRIGGPGDFDFEKQGLRIFEVLTRYYSEPWRHYHTMNHIRDFMDALDQFEGCPLEVRIAGWFHDVIWLPGYAQAEERSAEFAAYWLTTIGCEKAFVDKVTALIMATKHNGECPGSMAEAFMRDADLWSLGEPDMNLFVPTQNNVRAEFAAVAPEVYNLSRSQFFVKMCRNAIYWTEQGKLREPTAVRNLRKVKVFGPNEPKWAK